MHLRKRTIATLAAAMLALGAAACDDTEPETDAPGEQQQTGEGAEPEGGLGEEGAEEEEPLD